MPTMYGKISVHHCGVTAPAAKRAVCIAMATVEMPTLTWHIRLKMRGDWAVHRDFKLLTIFRTMVPFLLLSCAQLCDLDLDVRHLILQFLHVLTVVHEEVVIVLYLHLQYRDTAVQLDPCPDEGYEHRDERADKRIP